MENCLPIYRQKYQEEGKILNLFSGLFAVEASCTSVPVRPCAQLKHHLFMVD